MSLKKICIIFILGLFSCFTIQADEIYQFVASHISESGCEEQITIKDFKDCYDSYVLIKSDSVFLYVEDSKPYVFVNPELLSPDSLKFDRLYSITEISGEERFPWELHIFNNQEHTESLRQNGNDDSMIAREFDFTSKIKEIKFCFITLDHSK